MWFADFVASPLDLAQLEQRGLDGAGIAMPLFDYQLDYLDRAISDVLPSEIALDATSVRQLAIEIARVDPTLWPDLQNLWLRQEN